MRASSLRIVCQCNNTGVYYACIHHRFLFAAYFLDGKRMGKRVSTWSRIFMQAIVEPKRASTPGDTRLPRAQAVNVSLLPMVYFMYKFKYTTAACPPHVPRTGKV